MGLGSLGVIGDGRIVFILIWANFIVVSRVIVTEGVKTIEYSDGETFIKVSKHIVRFAKEVVDRNVETLLRFISKLREDGFLYNGPIGTYVVSIKHVDGIPVIIEVYCHLDKFTIRVRKHEINGIEETVIREWSIPYDAEPSSVRRIIA